MSSSFLALAYCVGIVGLQCFGCVHDRLTDRTWIYITLGFILVGTVVQVPLFPENEVLETAKFTLGMCLILPGLATNTAVANSTATKYKISSQWLYTQDMIGMLQILTQTTLARIVGPLLGYVLAIESMKLTLLLQALVTLSSFALTCAGVSSNVAETAEGRASLRSSPSAASDTNTA